ncbi:UPF0545 protein C22orf39 homolog isoform X2 [Paramacrobiotus metropolitanus]|nr:UPF0545 protein C22orf39 homolog isoform X2 [Paramacrobiotus metropolitanus]
MYRDEYRECKSIRGRFHQLFTTGETFSCEEWKDDFKDCLQWFKKMDQAALKRVVQHEKARVAKRTLNAVSNDVWEQRSEAPADWALPLPNTINNLFKTSPLARSREKEEKDKSL